MSLKDILHIHHTSVVTALREPIWGKHATHSSPWTQKLEQGTHRCRPGGHLWVAGQRTLQEGAGLDRITGQVCCNVATLATSSYPRGAEGSAELAMRQGSGWSDPSYLGQLCLQCSHFLWDSWQYMSNKHAPSVAEDTMH